MLLDLQLIINNSKKNKNKKDPQEAEFDSSDRNEPKSWAT